MYTRKKILDQLKQMKTYQKSIVDCYKTDRFAERFLKILREKIFDLENNHDENENKAKSVLFYNVDFRIFNDFTSEVSKTAIFSCCYNCCKVVEFFTKVRNMSVGRGTFYTIEEDKNYKLDEKIIIIKRFNH